MAKSNNEIKATRKVIKKLSGKIPSVKQFPNLLLNYGKLKDQKL
jgi:hypothetical protein